MLLQILLKTPFTEMALAPSFLNIYENGYQLWVLRNWGYERVGINMHEYLLAPSKV